MIDAAQLGEELLEAGDLRSLRQLTGTKDLEHEALFVGAQGDISGTTVGAVGHEAVAQGRSGARSARSSRIMVMNVSLERPVAAHTTLPVTWSPTTVR
jgi:hypothetical protein